MTITIYELTPVDGRKSFYGKAHVIETVCQGCGVCTATCPQGAIQLSHFTDNQILAEVNALCQC